MPHTPQSSLPRSVADAMTTASPSSRGFSRWLLACLLASGASVSSATPATPAAPQEMPRQPDCADLPVPPAIRELALPADQLARVIAALRAGCERDRQVREDNRRALAALLGPEQMQRVEGRLRPPPPPGAASAPCRPEGEAGLAGRRS